MTTSTSTDPFAQLQADVAAQGPLPALDRLAEHLAAEGRFHDLFDVRLMQSRLRLGLPAIFQQSADELPEPTRTQIEDAMLEACREVGRRLLEAGRVRDAWMYLRPVGERAETAAALASLADRDDLAEELIAVSLYEGVDPELGFRLVLREYGTCRAVTIYDEAMHQRPKADRQRVAALMVRHLHEELLDNVRAEITKEQGRTPTEASIAELVAQRDWLFAEDNYHIDTSHLAAVVRFALAIEDPAPLELAWQLTEYGRRLSPQYQYPGEAPFEDTYTAHGLFFAAQLGRDVDGALAYFEQLARSTDPHQSTGPGEVYVALLARIGRWRDALEAAAELLPPGLGTTGFAPNLQELARQAGALDRLVELSQQRGDLLGFAAGLVSR